MPFEIMEVRAVAAHVRAPSEYAYFKYDSVLSAAGPRSRTSSTPVRSSRNNIT